MKYLLNKYKILLIIALIINIPIFVLGVTRSNKQITLKGDTTLVSSLTTITPSYEEEGSFSTIYVTSVSHSTYLHNILAKLDKTCDISDMSTSSLHYTDSELSYSNKIMYQSARYTSLISGYTEAKKINDELYLDYTYIGVKVTSYSLNSNFRIGDIIYQMYDYETETTYDTSSYDDFINALNNLQSLNDIIYYKRNNVEYSICLSTDDIKSFGAYSMYEIDFTTSTFSVTYKKTNTGGPSGGLLQALEVFNRLTEFDYTKGLKISGTGTINQNGKVGIIGGIKQKIYTAFDDDVDIFFCPRNNYSDAKEAYDTLKNKEKMELVVVDTITDAINYLEEYNV